jgi:GPH family glycoside/pentoside/hexuronide:cation symporter
MFPIWPLLARRVGKRNAWLIALAMRMVGLACVLPGWNFAPLQMLALVLVGGSLSCTFIIPPSIQSDAIDHDELLTHDRKEGSYFAIWNFAQKLAAAAAIAIAGVVLQASGYAPGAEQSEATRNALRLFFVGVPFLLHGIAFAWLLQFRLDATEHARIRRELDRRRREDPPIPTARRQNPLSRPDGAQ